MASFPHISLHRFYIRFSKTFVELARLQEMRTVTIYVSTELQRVCFAFSPNPITQENVDISYPLRHFRHHRFVTCTLSRRLKKTVPWIAEMAEVDDFRYRHLIPIKVDEYQDTWFVDFAAALRVFLESRARNDLVLSPKARKQA
jgi:hypothetical protein